MRKSNVEEMANQERKNIVNMITILFDEKINKLMNKKLLNDVILKAFQNGEKEVVITIHPCINVHTYDLTFTTLIAEFCYEYKLGGLIKKQKRFLEFDLDDIVKRLRNFKVRYYEDIATDVINNSKNFNTFIEYLECNEYEVEVKKDVQMKYHTCSIVLS